MKIFGKEIKEHLYIPSLTNDTEKRRTYPLARNLFAARLPSLIDFTSLEENEVLPELRKNLLVKKEDFALSFQDHALRLMAACIGERKSCSVDDYELLLKECKIIFGDQALEPLFQARLHSVLLHKYSYKVRRDEVIQDFKHYLERNYEEIKLSHNTLSKLHSAIYSLSLQGIREQYGLASGFFEEVDLVFLEYQIERRKHKLFSEKLYSKVSAIKEIAENTSSKVFMKLQAEKKEQNLANKDFNSYSLLPIEKEKVEILGSCNDFALAFREIELLEKIQKFQELLLPQAFRIVVLGEGKRGKTSLINALLGKNILPTRSIVPETGTVLEISYRAQNKDLSAYNIEWIDSTELNSLQKTIEKEQDNILLKEKYSKLKEILESPSLFDILQNIKIKDIEELQKYSSADSIYSSIIKKISIELDDETLPKNVHFVDTPAINSSDLFSHYRTKEECLKADCLLVVLDSRQPDTSTVLNLLKDIAKEGRVVKIIGVLSHPHKSKEENILAKKRAIETLQEGIREVEGIELVEVFVFNPNEFAQKIEKSKKLLSTANFFSQDEEIEQGNFLQCLIDIIEKNRNYSLPKERIESLYGELVATIEENKNKAYKLNAQKIPSKEHIALLSSHAINLENATEEYAKNARVLIMSALVEVEQWRMNTEKFIDHLEEDINMRLSNEMHKYTNELGDDFAKPSAWEDFDKEIAPKLAEKIYEEFTENKNASLKIWEEKIENFSEEAGKLSMDCFSVIESSKKEMEKVFTIHSSLDHALVQANSHMKKIALLLSGATGGILASNGIANMLAFGTSFAILANTIVFPAISLAIGAYAINKLGDPIKRKKSFLARKEEEIQKYSANLAKELNRQANDIQEELLNLYSKAVLKALLPALEIMAYEAINMRLYIEFIERQEKLCLDKDTE